MLKLDALSYRYPGAAAPALDPVQQVEFQIVGVLDVRTRQARHLVSLQRPHEERSDQHNQLLLDPPVPGIAEQGAQVGKIAQAGDARGTGVQLDQQQARQH